MRDVPIIFPMQRERDDIVKALWSRRDVAKKKWVVITLAQIAFPY